ncbi:phage tail sheath family protein [Adhaeribacter arboris]|uniref:Phage tail sheath family protein n=1 Tax=Adhaeribacter arboris TaxID=2072846 RepID=A0A2T2Y9Z5_9BACT|nr:phage tail sheath C-terminal domain-containing protein [Adhaeribacter arboris]PSR52327.1 phage tail sheath family protein [Adhaeribacter arboris]
MATTSYKTPGVYIEEITTLPPSVAEVETAIPIFIGYTELGTRNDPTRISSLVEYQDYFGFGELERSISVTVEKNANNPLEARVIGVSIDPAAKSRNVLYYALQLYFANGGGPCYIVSTGTYPDSANNPREAYGEALRASSKEDEPTLLVFPDAPFLLNPDDYYSLMNDALLECSRLGDRFTIVDVLNVNGDTQASVAAFRDRISANLTETKYGAAYYPYLNTSLDYRYNPEDVTVLLAGDDTAARAVEDSRQSAIVARRDADSARAEADRLKQAADAEGADAAAKKAFTEADRRAKDLEGKATTAQAAADAAGKAVSRQTWQDQNNAVQNQIKKLISNLGVQLTPCAAVAGVYAGVDSTRGVWKAPANVSLNYITSTAARITDEDQRDLNIDVVAGKSVNAIRSFVGMGTKIWGARTLAGNDNEWRYVNVRRFFNMVEESIKKSTYWAVFEPNDINTWVRVRAMIENYLLLKWKDGALAGVKPDDAFYVRVGLGTTMSPMDILEGRMIIEIGLAAVRPAEFIIIRFSHFLQKS